MRPVLRTYLDEIMYRYDRKQAFALITRFDKDNSPKFDSILCRCKNIFSYFFKGNRIIANNGFSSREAPILSFDGSLFYLIQSQFRTKTFIVSFFVDETSIVMKRKWKMLLCYNHFYLESLAPIQTSCNFHNNFFTRFEYQMPLFFWKGLRTSAAIKSQTIEFCGC